MGTDAHATGAGDDAGIVARRRIEDVFHAAAASPLTLVNAPAGYGKTIAARAFIAACPDPVAYVGYERSDDRDSAWGRLRAAVDGADAAPWVRATIDVLGRRDYTNLDRVAEVFDGSERPSQRLVVVLDGLDRVDDPRLVAELAIFVNRLPSDFRLVAVTERKLPLPTARWRAQGRLADIGPDELRFDYAEATAFFASHAGVSVPSPPVEALTDRAEGWPLGLDLLARLVGAHDDADASLDPQHPAAAAVVEKVLGAHPPEVRDFLLDTSVLSRFDADLCRAVTGRDDAGALLGRVEESNLFVFRVEDQPGWFRYCRLFAELMRSELDRRHPGRRTDLHRRAAAWWEQQGDVQRALRHLVAADRVEQAFEMANQDVYRPRRVQGVVGVDWERIFSPSWIGQDASRMVQFATLLGRSGSLDEAAKWIDRAERAVDAVPVDDPRHATMLATQALWHAVHLDGPATLAHGEPALRLLPREDWSQPLVERLHLALAHAHLTLGDLDDAERYLEELAGVTRSDRVRDLLMPALTARLAWQRGELGPATEIAERTIRVAAAMGLDMHPAVADAHSALGDVLTERGRPGEAMPHVEHAVRSVEALGWTGLGAFARLGLVRTTAVRDGPAAALDVLHDVRQSVAGTLTERGLSADIDALEARLRLGAEELDSAEELTAGLPSGQQRTLLEVRLALAHGDAEGAAARLTDLAPPHRREQIVVQLLAARAAALTGRAANRDRALLDAARQGWPEGFVTVYLDEAPELVRRLRELVERDLRLREAAPAATVGSAASAPLTERETEVLRYLRSDLTNPEIAGQLGISENTLKSHVRGLYRKLGVTSRAAAVTTARQAGLL